MLKSNLIRAAIFASLLIASAVPSYSQTTKTSIEKMSGWESCSACAGAGGSGPTMTHYMKQGISSPSMGGTSAEYGISPKVQYGDALWWKQLGASSSSHNFQYDVYYYLKNPGASQALEFDVNQSVGGHKFIFGTQCNIAAHSYDVWSSATHWVHTGIPCSAPAAYKWHHIRLEFKRTSTGKVMFVSVSIDGNLKYINRTFSPQGSSVTELNVAFQMDGNVYKTAYQSWLQNVSLKYW